MGIFHELGIIIIFSTLLVFLFRLIKQPAIPGYILAGFIIGPAFGTFLFNHGILPVPGIIHDIEIVKGISDIGLAFLLFIVGLKISINKLKDVGSVATIGATLQFILLATGGFFLSRAFFPTIPSIYMGVAMSFGSTMVVISILTKKNELDTLHGRIAIGILLVQDIIAIIAITLLSSFASSPKGSAIFIALLIAILKVGFLVLLTYVASVYLFPKLFKFAAKSSELLLLLSISVAFLFSIIADKIGVTIVWILQALSFTLTPETIEIISPGFSIAIGAFMGGVALASLPYSVEISSRISSLKDFFASIFFVTLGVELVFDDFTLILPAILSLLLFILIVKPVVITMITALFGYEKRTSFFSGMMLFQISEFGIIVATLGYSTGLMADQKYMSIIILLAAISMILTSYTIQYQNHLFELFGKHMHFLQILTRKNNNLQYLPDSISKEVVLIGYNRIGYSIFKTLKKLKKNFLVLDYNPEVIKHLIHDKVHCIYGDANNIDTLNKLHFEKAQMVISTIPDFETNKLIIQKAKKINKDSMIFVTAYHPEDALDLYDAGADYVILPHYLGGDHVSLLLEDITTDISGMVKHKFNHIQELHERKGNSHVV